VPQGGVGEGAGDERLADPGRADDEDGPVGDHPGAAGELRDERAVEPPGQVEVELLDRRARPQPGRFCEWP